MSPDPFAKVPLYAREARVCPTCGALIYDRDDAEKAHRRFHTEETRHFPLLAAL